MYWLLVACLGLIFCNQSAAAGREPHLSLKLVQKPRFLGAKIENNVRITCIASDMNPNVTWYKACKYDIEPGRRNLLKQSNSITYWNRTGTRGIIIIKNLKIEDSGVYFCRINDIWGTGTELQVSRHIHFESAERRSNLKDFFIFVQAILLTLLVFAPLLKHQTLVQKEEAIYDEPEQDHIYEGLEIEHCCDLYEDISMYAQQEPAEGAAVWKQE
ncbi:hypothetical protein DPEC_G00356590 [Dallia pectoralis]|uniref:Uncharacterized protein n=1 Tax=Dallia pectoralis TaxID=75939 RepID=A0ACC2EZR9_DALPE|nr:hypothetical protein DPEC_G00356590 [Dallia pectoralis]